MQAGFVQCREALAATRPVPTIPRPSAPARTRRAAYSGSPRRATRLSARRSAPISSRESAPFAQLQPPARFLCLAAQSDCLLFCRFRLRGCSAACLGRPQCLLRTRASASGKLSTLQKAQLVNGRTCWRRFALKRRRCAAVRSLCALCCALPSHAQRNQARTRRLVARSASNDPFMLDSL